jgi:hypothetical protein
MLSLDDVTRCYADYIKQLNLLRECKGDFECFMSQSFGTWQQYEKYFKARQEYESGRADAAGTPTLKPPDPSPDPGTLENAIRKMWRKDWPAD